MKPVLYWTLRQSYRTFTPLGVTSEGARGRINGRYEDGAPTHSNKRHTVGRFDSLEDAQRKVKVLKSISEKYQAARDPHDQMVRELHRAETKAIEVELKK